MMSSMTRPWITSRCQRTRKSFYTGKSSTSMKLKKSCIDWQTVCLLRSLLSRMCMIIRWRICLIKCISPRDLSLITPSCSTDMKAVTPSKSSKRSSTESKVTRETCCTRSLIQTKMKNWTMLLKSWLWKDFIRGPAEKNSNYNPNLKERVKTASSEKLRVNKISQIRKTRLFKNYKKNCRLKIRKTVS